MGVILVLFLTAYLLSAGFVNVGGNYYTTYTPPRDAVLVPVENIELQRGLVFGGTVMSMVSYTREGKYISLIRTLFSVIVFIVVAIVTVFGE